MRKVPVDVVIMALVVALTLWLQLSEVPKFENSLKEIDLRLQKQTDTSNELREQLNKASEREQQYQEQIRELQKELDKAKSQVSTKGLDGFQITWYNDSGTTASGAQTKDGTTISVDPHVIPLGTWVKIVLPDGREFVRKAEDTGGAVKGNIIDMYANAPTSELVSRGRVRGAKVYLLKGGAN